MPEPRLSATGGDTQRVAVTAVWRDVADAGLRYYARLGGLALALTEAIVPAIGELRPTARLSSEPSRPAAAP